ARLASTFRSATERAGLRLVVDCPPLPAPVHVDRDMWEKIVLNLVANAVKFTFDGEVRVRVRAVDGAAQLEVADTGVGIAPEELPHVFERFHRVPGVRSRTHEGTGIGLALVRELVEMHGGRAEASSVADLVDTVVERVAARPLRDDVAVLALEAAEPNRFALRLPADPTRLSVLRRRLEDFLTAHRVGENDLFDLTVAVSEAAANAIEHPVCPAEPTIGVEVTIADGTVVATVRDSGQWRESTGAGFRGRGLALIRALGDLTVSRTAEGTQVTLRRRLRG
ncbi:ATP-binding protein, partial [Micromonospora sp. DH15]|nr:ATP-binding protein [Micromonospora sp. DH15]